ncbi:MAG: hypothetical protein CMF69_11395 [Magnetovibrio sp.]|nr:hypothetical protein [Magnetovibrio sp.]|tara:strand:- start:17 stop:235 length:219 start_codon:yes stop_codon:yes gene_type:complete
MNQSDEEEELVPIIDYPTGNKVLYFHWPKTGELFRLKNGWLHNKLKMFGTFRNIHIERKDLILVGNMSDLKK